MKFILLKSTHFFTFLALITQLFASSHDLQEEPRMRTGGAMGLTTHEMRQMFHNQIRAMGPAGFQQLHEHFQATHGQELDEFVQRLLPADMLLYLTIPQINAIGFDPKDDPVTLGIKLMRLGMKLQDAPESDRGRAHQLNLRNATFDNAAFTALQAVNALQNPAQQLDLLVSCGQLYRWAATGCTDGAKLTDRLNRAVHLLTQAQTLLPLVDASIAQTYRHKLVEERVKLLPFYQMS